MNLEPQKFFIGLVDFFSILLPGALLTYLLKDNAGPYILGDNFGSLANAEAWIIFAFCAYLIGHFVFLLGSALDPHVADPIRDGTYRCQVRKLADGKAPSSRFTQFLAKWWVSEKADLALEQVVMIKSYYLPPGSSDAINAFQWCKCRLKLENPEALAIVQRFEADSKFFRSLVIVLLVLVPFGIFTEIGITVTSLVLLPFALWRYVNQRVKSTTQSYWFVITLEGALEDSGLGTSPKEVPGLSHAGGVVYKIVDRRLHYLLVRAKNDPKEWVLPKGHIEPGEDARRAAVREVREESGVWGRVAGQLEDVSFVARGEPVNARCFLMECVAEGKPQEQREQVWLPLDRALEVASHDETRQLLRCASEAAARLYQRGSTQ